MVTMSAKLEAIDTHLPELEVTVGDLVNAISKDCWTKGIIKKEVYKNLRKSAKSKRERTKTLVSHVWKCIREDDNKAELFIQTLARYKHCQDLVRKIRKDQEDIEDRTRVAQAMDTSKGTMLLPARKPRKKLGARSHSQCTENSTDGNSTKIGITRGLCLNPGAEGHYNTKMELAELEAKLNDAEESNKKLEAEKKETRDEWNAVQRKRSALEKQLQLKDQEIDSLSTEVENLKSSSGILRLTISRLEKKKYADKETIDKRIEEDKTKIRRLETEKEETKSAFEAYNEKYKKLQQKVHLLDGIARSYEATIETLKSQAEQENRSNTSRKFMPELGLLKYIMIVVVVSLLVIITGIALAYY